MICRIFVTHYTPLKIRKKYIEEQFAEHGIDNYIFIELFDREYNNTHDSFYKFSNNLLPSEISIFLKHMEIFRYVSDEEIIVVMEDDSILKPGFKDNLENYIFKLIRSNLVWDIAFCGECCGLHIDSKLIESEKIFYSSDTTRCLNLYILNAGSGKKIKEIMDNEISINKPIDCWLNDMRIKYKNLNFFWSEPTLSDQKSEINNESSIRFRPI